MKKWLFTSIALNVLITLAWLFKHQQRAHMRDAALKAAEDQKRNYKAARIEYLKSLPEDSIVFIGTSLTEGARFKGTNLGIAGAQSADILKLLPIKAKVIYLEVGINDFINGVSVDSAYRNYQRILSGLHGKVVKHSVPLISKNYLSNYREINEKIERFNNLIHPEVILPCGDSLTYDGIHYNCKGYGIWVDEIKKLPAQE